MYTSSTAYLEIKNHPYSSFKHLLQLSTTSFAPSLLFFRTSAPALSNIFAASLLFHTTALIRGVLMYTSSTAYLEIKILTKNEM